MFNSYTRLTEVAVVFLKLGTIGFGGPAAHIAMLEAEVVNRRQCISQAQFLDLIGLTNLIPGPNSTELAIYIGYLRAGWWGLIIAGVCFILPAMAIVWGLAIGYDWVQAIPESIAICASIKPVVVVLTIQAMWKLRRSAIKNITTGVAGIDAIAIGQITPGPLFTTATFIGYLLAGHQGAIAATIGIFLPSFGFVALLTFWAPRLRHSLWFRSWLDGVNAGAWGAIVVVAYRLGVSTLVDWQSLAIAVVSSLLLWRWRIEAIWLIFGSATIGLIGQLARHP